MIKVKADMGGIPEGMAQILKEDLPFATALALTRAAQAGQQAGQKLVHGVFHERNNWTEKGIRITPATKKNLIAEVYTDTSNRRTGAPDYLLLQEDGGEKVHHNGKTHFAIPTKWCRQLAGGENAAIPDWLRPNALLKYFQTGNTYKTRGFTRKDGTKGGGKVRNQPVLIKGFYFFKVQFKSGAEGIMARYATDPRSAMYPIYILVTKAHVRKRFVLEETVEELIERNFPDVFSQAAAEVLAGRGNVLAFGPTR